MSYYEDIIQKINELKTTNPLLAYSYLQEELSMPYIEKELHQKLIILEQEIKGYLPQVKKDINIQETLYDEEQFMQAIEQLRNSNIRNYLDVIEQYLCSDEEHLKKGLVILLLIDQNIHETIKMQKDGLEIEFSPNQIEIPAEQEIIIELVEDIESKLFQYPIIKQACIDELFRKSIANLPFSYSDMEGIQMLQEIYREICELYDEKDLLKMINTCK